MFSAVKRTRNKVFILFQLPTGIIPYRTVSYCTVHVPCSELGVCFVFVIRMLLLLL